MTNSSLLGAAVALLIAAPVARGQAPAQQQSEQGGWSQPGVSPAPQPGAQPQQQQQQPAPPQPAQPQAPAQQQPPPPPGSAPAGSASSSSTSGHTAAPGGAASQQVVVNPPSGTPSGQPPSSTTIVNPPGTQYAQQGTVFIEREPIPEPRNPLATVALDAAYGGAAGLLIGTGVALVDEWDDWQRHLSVGTGLGLIVGAGVGVVHATIDARNYDRERRRREARLGTLPAPPASQALDGLGSPVRDPVIQQPPQVAWSGRF